MLGLVVLASACGGGSSKPSETTPGASASASGGPAPGDLVPLDRYPAKVPPHLSPFPTGLVYAGKADVRRLSKQAMRVVRFGEGHPAFEPSILVGSPGQRLELSISNRTPVLHNFSTLDGKIDHDVGIGRSMSVTVTFPAKGMLIFYCKYHLNDSQIGELEARR